MDNRSTRNLRKKVVPVSPTAPPSRDALPGVLRGQTPPLGTSAEARRGSAQTVPRDRRHHSTSLIDITKLQNNSSKYDQIDIVVQTTVANIINVNRNLYTLFDNN